MWQQRMACKEEDTVAMVIKTLLKQKQLPPEKDIDVARIEHGQLKRDIEHYKQQNEQLKSLGCKHVMQVKCC